MRREQKVYIVCIIYGAIGELIVPLTFNDKNQLLSLSSINYLKFHGVQLHMSIYIVSWVHVFSAFNCKKYSKLAGYWIVCTLCTLLHVQLLTYHLASLPVGPVNCRVLFGQLRNDTS